MKLLYRIASLLVAALVVAPALSVAQDVVTIQSDPYGMGATCWNMTVKNGNLPGHAPINRVGIRITTPGITFDNALGPNSWDANLVGQDSVYYVSNGASITYPQSLNNFAFCLYNPPFDQEVSIRWTTMSNATVVGTGSLTVVPLTFQSLAILDTVTASANVTNNDPTFNFSVQNRNSAFVAIHAISFELQGSTSGTIRPGAIKAPDGWTFDSATVMRAYFHATLGNNLAPDNTLGGFIVAIRGNQQQAFSWVWRAIDDNGTLIERDTVRNVAPTGTWTSAASRDSVEASTESGCLYTYNVHNWHTRNAAPPSAITRFTLTINTAGVSFLSAPTTPANWGRAISTNGDTLTFQAATAKDALASGLSSNFFQTSVDNPTGGTFAVQWRTYSGTSLADSGLLNLTCSVAQAANDTATIAPGNSPCTFELTVTNKHVPPSNITSITLSAADGSFDGIPAVIPSTWTATTISPTSLKFAASGQDFITSNAQAQLIFGIESSGSNPVTITWATHDANNAVISSNTVTASCNSFTPTDSVIISADDPNSCLYNMAIGNYRGDGKSLVSATLAPTNGWKVDSISAPIGWTTSVDAQGVATITSATGIPDQFKQGGFHIGFIGVGTPSTFNVEVTTANSDQVLFHDTLAMECTPTAGVAAESQYPLDLQVAPNPLHAMASITFSVPYHGPVTIALMDVMGRTVRTVVTSTEDPGVHTASFNAAIFPAGTYYLRMETSTGRITRKLVIN